MKILGLTGSIGMGKTTAAGQLRRMGIPVYDADATVHALLARGGAAVPRIARLFSEAIRDGAVDRQALGRRVFDDPAALRRLEAVLHPLVREAENRFLRHAARHRRDLVVLDIPLLFETGGESRCDAVVVVTAPAFLQEQRVLRRPGMTREKLAAIRARQMPDGEKRRRADFVVPTGLGRAESLHRLAEIVKVVRRRRGGKWPPPRIGHGGAHARNCTRHRNHGP